MFDYFYNQTNIAAFNVGFNIFFETRPIIFLVNEFADFIDTKMAC